MIVPLGLSALLLGGAVVGGSAPVTSVATASDRNVAATEKAAATAAKRADKALAKHDAAHAVGFAETAVQLAPRAPSYRLLLAQSYLQAGRFQSARAAYADLLTLTPDNGKAALNLALSQVATGDWQAAQKTLDAHATTIPAGDLGLALALAGNPAGAVALLTTAARSPGADAKIRQNLALALALEGNWAAARVVASADMSPADVDNRIEQWAAFAQPRSSSDQVATLLGVTAVQDAGQPQALALNAPVPVVAAAPVAVAAVAPTPSAPVEIAEASPEALPVVAPVAPTPIAPVLPAAEKVVQAVPAPVKMVQAVPAPAPVRTLHAAGPIKVAAVAAKPAPIVRGDWFVQVGAYQNVAVARDGWSRLSHRFASLQGHQPTGTTFSTKAGNFYRLSVGGFARGQADQICRSYRARGGACFVRKAAGDQVAQWVKKPVQLAAR